MKIVNRSYLSTIFAKNSIIDIWEVPKYTYAYFLAVNPLQGRVNSLEALLSRSVTLRCYHVWQNKVLKTFDLLKSHSLPFPKLQGLFKGTKTKLQKINLRLKPVICVLLALWFWYLRSNKEKLKKRNEKLKETKLIIFDT